MKKYFKKNWQKLQIWERKSCKSLNLWYDIYVSVRLLFALMKIDANFLGLSVKEGIFWHK